MEQSYSDKSQSEIAEMIACLRDRNPRIRAGHAVLLGQQHIQEAFEPILHLLDDGDVMVVGAAARSLSDLGDKRAIPGLVLALDRLSDLAGLFKAARYAFGVSRGLIMYDAGPSATSSKPLGKEERFVATAIEGIAEQVDMEFQNLGARVHSEIMTALAKFGDESAVTPIANLLACPSDRPTPSFREDAAKALTELIKNMPSNEDTLNVISTIESHLLFAYRYKGSSAPVEQAAWQEANAAVSATLGTLRWKRRVIRKALGKPAGNLWSTILNWLGV